MVNEIFLYCQDIVRAFTFDKREDEDFWRELDEKKFKAHLAISRIIWENYNKRLSKNTDYKEIKNIHDNIQFITSDLSKSIGFKFKQNITLKEIEDYSEKLVQKITEYINSCQWTDLIKPKYTFTGESKIKWEFPLIDNEVKSIR